MKKIVVGIVFIIIIGLFIKFGTYQISNTSNDNLYNVKFINGENTSVNISNEIEAGTSKRFIKKPIPMQEGLVNLLAEDENGNEIVIYSCYVPPFHYDEKYIYNENQ